jgi:flagellar M-ring protein FliF
VHDVRLKLASAGLPKGSVVGFELMESQKFGTTQFQERLNFQRGLEGELTRSIQALSSVESARVHLALPNQNGFFREQQKPSASVVLTLHPGRTLDRNQIAGIVHLVSVQRARDDPKAVSVVDQHRRAAVGPRGGRQRPGPGLAAAAVRAPDGSQPPSVCWPCWSRWWADNLRAR